MKKGFTLIELLIVMVLVGILVTIALPKYRASMERGRATEGITNLKAASDAVNAQYIIDGNQYLVKEQDSVVNELNREQQSGDDELMTEEEYNYFKNAFMQALNSMSSDVIKQDDNSYSEPVLAKNLYDVYSGSYNRFI